MMWTKRVTRKELAEILQQQRLNTFNGIEKVDRLSIRESFEEIGLLWKHDPVGHAGAPNACIVPRERQREFFAWVATYTPSVRPLTAICHVVDSATAKRTLDVNNPPDLGPLLSAAIGLIFGEALTNAPEKRTLRTVSSQACLSTLSYSLSRAVALGLSSKAVEELPARWERGRFAANASRVSEAHRLLYPVWSVVGFLATKRNDLFGTKIEVPIWQTPPPIVIRACEDFFSLGTINRPVWAELSNGIPQIEDLGDTLSAPREMRVLALDAAIRQLHHRDSDERIHSFLVAFLANAINPGSLDHAELLFPVLPVLPDVLLWYGLLAGISPQSSITAACNGVGRRVIRELLRQEDLLDAPVCDIALEELETLMQSAKGLTELRLGITDVAIVELMPGVNARFKFGQNDQVSLPMITGETFNIIHDLDRQIDLISRSLNRLKRNFGLVEEDRKIIRKAKRRPDDF